MLKLIFFLRTKCKPTLKRKLIIENFYFIMLNYFSKFQNPKYLNIYI